MVTINLTDEEYVMLRCLFHRFVKEQERVPVKKNGLKRMVI